MSEGNGKPGQDHMVAILSDILQAMNGLRSDVQAQGRDIAGIRSELRDYAAAMIASPMPDRRMI